MNKNPAEVDSQSGLFYCRSNAASLLSMNDYPEQPINKYIKRFLG
jgi:hypothetical protein